MKTTLKHTLKSERYALTTSVIITSCIATLIFEQDLLSKQNQSLQVYPTHTKRLQFSHASHEKTSCETCHTNIAQSQRTADINSPSMRVCTSCHNASDTPKPRVDQCSECHTNYSPKHDLDAHALLKDDAWNSVSPPPLITPRQQAQLHFSHAKHANSKCSTCHDMSQSTPSMPTMETCIECHTQQHITTDCASCHTQNISPIQSSKTLDRPPSVDGLTTRRKDDAPKNHTQDWQQRHGVVALLAREDCMTCHTEQSCASCHNAQATTPLAHHPPNYLVTHRLSARQDTEECTSCHVNEATCLDCHQRMMAAPPSATTSGPPPRINVHPPSWLDASSATNHGIMARRNINECASCHSEQDCVSCHQGISPHPPEFALNCQTWVKTNTSACIKCHTGSVDNLCP